MTTPPDDSSQPRSPEPANTPRHSAVDATAARAAFASASTLAPAPAQTTAQVLLAVRNGPNDPAWQLFTERYEPLLMAVARRLGLDDDSAQDLSQQTLLEFVRDLRAGQFDRERGRLRTWLLAIARNRVRDVLRRRGRADAGHGASAPLTEETADPRSLDAHLDEAWERELERRIAVEAFSRLRTSTSIAESTLRAFELVAIREVPAEAVATQCGMTVDQVYVARSRVASRLRELVASVAAEWQEDAPWTP